jgi:hypothetical protein
MSNLGIPEVFVIVFIVLTLLGTPALALILILALRRMAGTTSAASAASAVMTQPTQAPVHAAGQFRADGSAVFSSRGLRVQRIDRGVFHLVFEGFNPVRQYLVHCTPVASLAGEAPVIAEVLGGEARASFAAATPAEEGIVLWLRQPDQSLTDREFSVEIIEVQ